MRTSRHSGAEQGLMDDEEGEDSLWYSWSHEEHQDSLPTERAGPVMEEWP